MRARKPAAVSEEDAPPPDEVADAWPADEAAFTIGEATAPLARLCIVCGEEDCDEHHEIARLDAPSRTVHDAVARLQRAATEHRAAERALRALVLSEVAKGRGELEPTPASRTEQCPRCLIRDAEAAAAAAGTTKASTRKAKGENGQQALPFKLG